MSEWKVIADKAKKTGKKVHVGKVFEICVEKGSELPEGDKLRKFKGRTVFQGAYGAQPGFITQQNDGVQAYTQALMRGVETWVELPPDRWPKEWRNKFIRPVVLLRIALYGHPDSGGLWEQYCELMLLIVGFIVPDPEGWPSVFFHPELKLLLISRLCCRFQMSGPKENMSKGWSLIASNLRLTWKLPGKSIDILVATMLSDTKLDSRSRIILMLMSLTSHWLTRPRLPPPHATGLKTSRSLTTSTTST